MLNQYSANELLAMSRQNWPESVNPAHTFTIYLNRVRGLGFAKAQEHMQQNGLSATEFDVMAALRRAPPPHCSTPSELQRATLMTSGGITKILYQLEAKALVSRSIQAEDKRSKLVHLSAKGKQLIESTMMTLNTRDAALLGQVFSTQELEQLSHLLLKLLEVLEKK